MRGPLRLLMLAGLTALTGCGDLHRAPLPASLINLSIDGWDDIATSYRPPDPNDRLRFPWFGRFRADDGTELVLLHRHRRSAPEAVTVTGVIGSGRHESAMLFELGQGESATNGAVGTHWRASDDLPEQQVRLQPINPDAFVLAFDSGASLRFARHSVVAYDYLERVMIIGHRGLSFGGDLSDPNTILNNTMPAIEHAWRFGADGIEFDVVVPYDADRNDYALDEWRVFHPWGDKSSVPVESIGEHFKAPETVLEHVGASSDLVLVYIDPKLPKEPPDGLPRQVVDKLACVAHDAIAHRSDLRILIGAPTDELASAACCHFANRDVDPSISWVLEFNITVSPAALEAIGDIVEEEPDTGPAALSVMIQMVARGAGLLDVVVLDLEQEQIRRLEQTRRFVILWTPQNERQFALAVREAWINHPGGFGVLAKNPHRLALWLAAAADERSARGP